MVTRSKSKSPARGSSPTLRKTSPSSKKDSVRGQLNSYNNPMGRLRNEICAVIETEIYHLPDVQELLSSKLHCLKNLQRLTLGIHPSCMGAILHLESVQHFILDNLDGLPEWKTRFETTFPNFDVTISASHTQENIRDFFADVQQANLFNLPRFPASLLAALYSLRNVKEVVLSSMKPFGKLSHEVLPILIS